MVKTDLRKEFKNVHLKNKKADAFLTNIYKLGLNNSIMFKVLC